MEAHIEKNNIMKLGPSTIEDAKLYLTKDDKIELAQVLNMKQSGVMNALRGTRNINPIQVETIEDFIGKKIRDAKSKRRP